MQERTRTVFEELTEATTFPPGSMEYPPCRCGRPKCRDLLRQAIKRAQEVKLRRRKGMAL